GNGVTILFPLLFLAIGAAAAFIFTILRLQIAKHFENAHVFEKCLFGGLVTAWMDKVQIASTRFGIVGGPVTKFILPTLAIGIPFFQVVPVYPFPNFFSSLEGLVTDIVVKILFVCVCSAILLSIIRIWVFWWYVWHILQCLANHPL